MIYRVKTIDDWQAKTGQHWDFETQSAAEQHALAASVISDLVLFGVCRIEGDTITETAMAISGILIEVHRLDETP